MRRHRRPPLDDDDLLSEILLRLPPQPSSLPLASLVCKRWRGLACDPGFCRRFRIHHRRNPPLLGLFESHPIVPFLPTLDPPNRVSPGRFSLQLNDSRYVRSLGCRHGLALYLDRVLPQLLVWDPIHGDQRRIALPPGFGAERGLIHGAVLRAAGDAHFQFQVVLVGALDDGAGAEGQISVLTCVYSSETGVWGNLLSTLITAESCVNLGPAVLVGDSLYWILVTSLEDEFDPERQIIEFDLKRQSLAMIQLPVDMLKDYHLHLMPVRANGGGLGLFLVSNFTAQLWKRKTDCNGVASWGPRRTINLDEVLSLNSESEYLISILGYAEENNLVFLGTTEGVFMVQLESLQFTKLSGDVMFRRHHPFESVYTTETRIGGGHDGANLLQNT